MIIFRIKVVALPFICITGITQSFFIGVLIREMRDSAIKLIEVMLHTYFRTYTTMIKDTNRQIDNLVQHIFELIDNFLIDSIIYTI